MQRDKSCAENSLEREELWGQGLLEFSGSC